MRTLISALLLAAISTTASAQVRVKGYTRKDGTYVAPHYRSSPNSTVMDNYSTRGNTNPYTGQAGTVNPYATPAAPTYSSPWQTPQPSANPNPY